MRKLIAAGIFLAVLAGIAVTTVLLLREPPASTAGTNGGAVPIPVASSAALDCGPSPTGLYTTWLLCGPVKAEPADAAAVGEPGEGAKYAGAPWRVWLDPNGYVKVPPPEPDGPREGVYLFYGRLVVPEDAERKILVGTIYMDSNVAVYLRGERVGTAEPTGQFKVTLKKGENPVFLVVGATPRGCGFEFALLQTGFEARASREPIRLPVIEKTRKRALDLFAPLLRSEIAPPVLPPGRGEASVVVGLPCGAPLLAETLRITTHMTSGGGEARLFGDEEIPAREFMSKVREVARIEADPQDFQRADVTVEVFAGERSLRRIESRLWSVQGLQARLADLGRRTTILRLREPQLAAVPALRLEKCQHVLLGSAGGGVLTNETLRLVDELVTGVDEALKEAEAGRDPLAGETGWVERAYFSDADEAVQPYYLYLPKKAPAAGVKMPLLVLLHGYTSGYYDRLRWIENDMAVLRNATGLLERLGLAVLVPCGRTNTDFQGIGEKDVLDALESAMKLHSFDPDRVYLGGYSMGGQGVYTVAAHYPDLFAALLPIEARSDLFEWLLLDRKKAPPHKLLWLERENPLSLAENYLHLPTRIVHCEDDFIVPMFHAERMARRLESLGYAHELVKLPGGHMDFDPAFGDERTYTWLLERRRPTRPKRVVLTTWSTRYGRSFWVEVSHLEAWGKRARIEAEELEPGRVRVRTENVARFVLRDVPGAPGGGAPVVEGADGFDVGAIGSKGRYMIVGTRKRWTEPRLAKTRDLCGPVLEALNGPFLAIVGTGGDERTQGRLAGNAQAFAQDWFRFTLSTGPLMRTRADKEIKLDEISARNLVLFGTPSTNAVLKRIEGVLPVRYTTVEGREHVVVQGKAFDLSKRGIVFVYPNPFAPRKEPRYLLVYSGRYPGQFQSRNHKFDLLPDLVVFTGEPDWALDPWYAHKTNHAVLAAFFDEAWHFRKDLLWTYPDAPAPPPEERAFDEPAAPALPE